MENSTTTTNVTPEMIIAMTTMIAGPFLCALCAMGACAPCTSAVRSCLSSVAGGASSAAALIAGMFDRGNQPDTQLSNAPSSNTQSSDTQPHGVSLV